VDETGMLLATYTYGHPNHLTQVSTPRNTANGLGAHITQRLTSATNPENGTVSYTYNADGTLASKTDANNNQETLFLRRLSASRRHPRPNQTFTYDTCPAGATGCANAAGQLMQATFGDSTSTLGPNDLASRV
jgi:YD repeat-containing protein